MDKRILQQLRYTGFPFASSDHIPSTFDIRNALNDITSNIRVMEAKDGYVVHNERYIGHGRSMRDAYAALWITMHS